jgi:4-hydroxybenzoate polyprenyltransferase
MRFASAALRLLRPKQWTKNLLVLAAMIFTGTFTQPKFLVPGLIAFAAMCLASSATYVVNDLRDIEQDRNHPKKKLRPLAAGEIQPGAAMFIAIVALLGSIGLCLLLPAYALAVLVAYLLLQVCYNVSLKHIPVADVYCIAIGFVLRAAFGAVAIGVSISGWLLFCTGALALMIGFAKRRNEFIIQGEDRASSRQSLVHYSRASLDVFVAVFAAAAIMCYGMYTLESKTAAKFPGILLTAPFVFYGITRYVLLVLTMDEGGEPEDTLFRDPHLVASIVFFIVTAAAALSGLQIPFIER